MSSSQEHPAVVVGVDGSTSGLNAVRWAAQVALRDGVPLRLVHVYQLSLGLPVGAAMAETFLKELRERGERWIAEAREAVAGIDPALPVETVLRAETVTDALLHESGTASLLVLGTRGRSALTGLLVGCTSVTVAGHARCPVVIVHGASPDEAPRTSGPVVVGVDATGVSDSAITFAFAEASARDTTLVAVHAWTESVLERAMAAQTGSLDLFALEREARRTLAERLAPWQDKHPEVPVAREAVHDRPGRALRRHTSGAQLVVVGRRGRDAFRSLVLGSTSQYLVHHALCPVAVTRNEAE